MKKIFFDTPKHKLGHYLLVIFCGILMVSTIYVSYAFSDSIEGIINGQNSGIVEEMYTFINFQETYILLFILMVLVIISYIRKKSYDYVLLDTMGLKKKHRYMFIGFEYAGIIFSSVTGGLILGKILAECAKTVLQNIFYNTITTEVNYGFVALRNTLVISCEVFGILFIVFDELIACLGMDALLTVGKKNGKPLKKAEVLSQILVVDSEQISGDSLTGDNTILGPWFYLGEDLFKELYGEGNLVNYSFDADEKDAPAVRRMLNQISQEFSDVGFETTEQRHSEIENYKALVRILCVLIGGILGVIGIVNLVNIIFTNLIVRNRELATFRSIGATKKQLRELIIRESIGYVFYAAVGGFILATLIGMTAVRGICSSVWLFTFQFTLLPAAIVIVLYFIIAVIASEAGIYFWEKGSITERLRNL